MKIAVIGSGIAGLAAAAHLARARHTVSVFERFETARPLGAGLLLQPSGLMALETLGLRQAAERHGARITRLIGRTPGGRTVLDLRYADGRPGDVGIGIHRATLFNLLHEAARDAGVDWHTHCEVTRLGDPSRPVLESASGERFGPFELVLICDGAHSKLRDTVFPNARAPVYPWGALWRIAAEPDGRREGELEQVYSGCRIMLGALPVGDNPADPSGRPGVSFFWSIRHDAMAHWRERGIAPFREEMNRLWAKAGQINGDVTTPDDFAHAVYRDVRCPRWHQGRILLLGDAAHGMSPQLGQGANLALADASALARILQDNAPVLQALPAYEQMRRPTVTYYTWMSWALTPVFQSSSRILGLLRDVAFGIGCRLPGIRNWMAWTLAGRGRLPTKAPP